MDTFFTSVESGNIITTTFVAHTTSDVTYISNADGTTTSTFRKVVAGSATTTTNYTHNVIQDVLTNANTVTFVAMLAKLQTGNEATFGAGFRDPNEPSSPNIKTDATFDSDVNAVFTLITTANTVHQAVIGDTSNGYTDGQAHTYSNTAYAAMITGIGTFQTALALRITEISNRIGYVNGKSAGVANGGAGTKTTNHGAAAGGFVGTAFNGGGGYANTIYAHANFLAGKKIKLYQKILSAVEDIDALYANIKSKRSEYYEYNQ